MGVFALLGLFSLVLCSAVIIALPMCLAVWVAHDWLWLYAGYAAIIILFLFMVSIVKPKKDKGDS